MLGTSSSSLVGNPAAAAAGEAHDSGGSGEVGGGGAIPSGYSDEDKTRFEMGESGGGGGNRWPRQETLDLLRIRSEMEIAFRDSSLKGPLWEEISRKMSQLGYQRSAKKCKEKFENVYKYHKRTKDGRAAKSDGKTYRFFEQLEAFERNPPTLPLPPPPARPPQSQSQAQVPTTTIAAVMPMAAASSMNNPPTSSHVTVSSDAIPISFSPSVNNASFSIFASAQLPSAAAAVAEPTNPPQGNAFQSFHPHVSLSLPSDFTSSSTSSDEDIRRRHKRKRKMKDFFERLMKDVMEKQEQLQKKFFEAIEKRERDRMIREEAWRVQEMARLNRELDLLAQERSAATAKDAAVMAFLQKITGQQNPLNIQSPSINAPQIQVPQPQLPQNPPPHMSNTTQQTVSTAAETATVAAVPTQELHTPTLPTRNVGNNIGAENFLSPSSSRWPKAEVEALINLRKNLDLKYLDNGPKGPLWEEISAGMSKLGYSRSSKRCKEKWENINKYFKKVKESNKKRHEDSKTCPYFHQLDALYKEKAKAEASHSYSTAAYANAVKSENNSVAIIARPEQQWPIQQRESAMVEEDEDRESENYDENDDEEDDDEGEGYEIVTNQRHTPASVVTTTAG